MYFDIFNSRCNINISIYCIAAEVNKRCKLLREQVIQESQYDALKLLQVLMNVAKLELKLREVSVV